MKTYGRNGSRARVAGFALIETLIAFIVMAVGLLALLSFHSESQRNVSESKSQAEAVALAEQKLQELESFLSDTDDTRLVSTGTFTDAGLIDGVLASYSRGWFIENVSVSTHVTATPGKRATVWVNWNDRNEDEQEVRLSSEVYFEHPTSGLSNFLQVVDVAGKVYGLDNEFGTGTDTGVGEDVTGDRQIVETLVGQASDDPLDGALQNTYIFAVTVSGSITRSGGATGDVVIENPSATAVTSLLIEGRVYTPSCTSGNNAYSCTLFYSSATSPPGWTGTISIRLGRDDVFCTVGSPSPGTWQLGTYNGGNFTGVQGDLIFSGSGLLESKVFDITIGSGNNPC